MNDHYALTFLTRLARRKPAQIGRLSALLADRLERLAPIAVSVAQETGDPIGQVLADLLDRLPRPALAGRLDPLVARAREAVALRELALTITRQLLAEEADTAIGERKVALLNNMAVRLRELGRFEEALSFAEQAVEGFRKIGKTYPETGMALIALGYIYDGLGRHRESATVAQEAVDHFSALVDQGDERFQSDLGIALHNLAGKLGDLGDWDQALSIMDRCVALRRYLAQVDPKIHLPNFVRSLMVQSSLLGEAGRLGENLQALEEVVTLYHRLREDQPNAYVPELATALVNLAAVLTDLQRHKDAYANIREAVELRRQLAQARSEAFDSALLAALNLEATILAAAEDPEALVQTAQEAIVVARRLAATNPDIHNEALARTLSNLARAHSETKEDHLAVDAAREALASSRKLAEDGRLPAIANLARNLNNLSHYLNLIDHDEEALAVASEAVEIYGALHGQAPQTYAPSWSVAWNTLARRQYDLGQLQRAYESNLRAQDILRPLAEAEPGAFGPWAASFAKDDALFARKLGIESDATPS